MSRTKGLDKKRPYGTVRPVGDSSGKLISCRYSQDLKFFDANGKFVCNMPGQIQPGETQPSKAPEAEKHVTTEELKADALSKAADKLKGFSSFLPDAEKDAAKENAGALAAEENA